MLHLQSFNTNIHLYKNFDSKLHRDWEKFTTPWYLWQKTIIIAYRNNLLMGLIKMYEPKTTGWNGWWILAIDKVEYRIWVVGFWYEVN